MAAIDPGKWYLVVECRNPKCRRAIVLLEAPDDPTEDVALADELSLRCPYCGRAGMYRPFDVRRTQAQERP